MYKISFLIIFIHFNASGVTQTISLDSIINVKLQKMHMPGLAACTVDSGRIRWAGYYGYQNIERSIPVSSNTLFHISSVSKTITASAIAQLISKGKLRLDDDINLYLPFRVRNPYFPVIPITVGELLRHRSSIIDNYDYLQPVWDTSKGDPKITLSAFLKDYLTPHGSHYDKQKNFLNDKPNAQRSYSNVGFALLGYLVQCVTKQPYDNYCTKNIFEPLSMNHTAWFLKDLDTNLVAMPYHYSDSLHQYIPYYHGGYPDYPAGLLRTSAEQLAHFLIAWTSNGRWQNKQVFDSTTIQLFTPKDIRLGCYTWNIFSAPKGIQVMYGHTGGDNGVFTIMAFQPETNKGFVLLFNGDFNGDSETNGETMHELLSAMYESMFR